MNRFFVCSLRLLAPFPPWRCLLFHNRAAATGTSTATLAASIALGHLLAPVHLLNCKVECSCEHWRAIRAVHEWSAAPPGPFFPIRARKQPSLGCSFSGHLLLQLKQY